MDISEVTRRNIIDYLLLREESLRESFHGRLGVISFLEKLELWGMVNKKCKDFGSI